LNQWTEEEVATLRREAALGKSAREIAIAVGPRHTKNSVVGKTHRLGIKLTGNRRPEKRSDPAIESAPRIARPPQQASKFIVKPVARTFEAKPSPTSESPHVPGADHEDWMCGCLYDDKTWCSGRKAQVTVGHRTRQSNWCEFHRQMFTKERGSGNVPIRSSRKY
jgi:hypothetical protein